MAPVAPSEAPFASWPRSEFASTYSPSEVEAAEFAVPDVGAAGAEEVQRVSSAPRSDDEPAFGAVMSGRWQVAAPDSYSAATRPDLTA